MKRILYSLVFSLIVLSGYGQMIIDSYRFNTVETEYTAILTNAATNGYTAPTPTDQVLQNYLVRYLKDIGVWTLTDWMAVYDKGSLNFGRINWKLPGTFNATVNGTVTFTADQGVASNGTTGYITRGWIASTNGVNYTVNGAGVICYVYSNSAINSSAMFGAANTGPTNQTLLNPRNSSGDFAVGVNTSSGNNLITAVSRANGVWHLKRTSSTNMQAYSDGVLRGTSTATVASRPTVQMAELANNINGSVSQFTTRSMGLIMVGASYSGLELEIYNGVNAYIADDLTFFTTYFGQ